MNPSRYLPPPAAANPIPDDPSPAAWVTMSRVRHPVLGWLLLQKRNGSSRTVIEKIRR
jgi:hypothetical protein